MSFRNHLPTSLQDEILLKFLYSKDLQLLLLYF